MNVRRQICQEQKQNKTKKEEKEEKKVKTNNQLRKTNV
jgi:hypothetical protein